MSVSQGPGPSGVSRVMVFIDGGYLREGLRRSFENDAINYLALSKGLAQDCKIDYLGPLLIRSYYYDAVPETSDPDYNTMQDYLSKIRGRDFLEVRLGRLKRSPKEGRKQKGVDSLIAIDMLTKAYRDHYDIAVLVAGDDDFLDLVQAVKNAGKTIFGAYFEDSISKKLSDEFDRRLFLKRDVLDSWRTSRL